MKNAICYRKLGFAIVALLILSAVFCGDGQPPPTQRSKSAYESSNPLVRAAARSDISSIELLVSEGMDINVMDEDGTAPIHAASVNGNSETIQCLINLGCDVNLRDGSGGRGYTPLILASANRNWDATRLLLVAGANPDLVARRGVTAYLFASDKARFRQLVEEYSDYSRNESGKNDDARNRKLQGPTNPDG